MKIKKVGSISKNMWTTDNMLEEYAVKKQN